MRDVSKNVFERLGLSARPVFLAPLAGVSDHPFRRLCAAKGATLTYVEMISAAALVHNSERTLLMMKRHEEEGVLGVQITGRNAQEVGDAVAILDGMSFETIDINMGCPVQKVVKNGCGSAILKDPKRVYETVQLARQRTGKPLSVKVRLGWDHTTRNVLEVAAAAQAAGADWITVHGRTRSDDYSVPVDLDMIRQVKERCQIPVIGNGNLFSRADSEHMLTTTGVDGVMISRGALGNPWIFAEHNVSTPVSVSLDDWLSTVLTHVRWHGEEYGISGVGALTMRKHLLWYLKGWPGAKPIKEQVQGMDDLDEVRGSLESFAGELVRTGVRSRFDLVESQGVGQKFVWDPKYDMNRQLDRGVGAEDPGLAPPLS